MARKDYKEMVKDVLVKYPETRDCDKLLWLRCMEDYRDFRNIFKTKSYDEFAIFLLKGNSISQQSLGRTRRRLQEQNIEFRGKKYIERQKERSLLISYLKEF